MSSFYVYILQSIKDGRTYVGQTNNLEKRFAEHNAGRVLSTKSRIPFKLLFSETYETSKQAKDRELWWKSSSGRRELKKFFNTLRSFLITCALISPLGAAETPKKEPLVPAFSQFVRTLDVEGNVAALGREHIGSQGLRIETRYLDPDVNAFVGIIGTISRFNDKLHIGEPPDEKTAYFVANWGIDIGLVRGRHLWALDLMGASLGNHVAFGPAIVGEHDIVKRWKLYHRTTLDFYSGDTIVDSDQGFLWNPWETVGFTAGYRIFTAQHTSLNGPRIGVLWRFQNPKIPFIFPSLG